MISTSTRPLYRALRASLKATAAFLIGLCFAVSCGTCKNIPPAENNHSVEVRDSVRIVDSVRVIPIERVTDIVALPDTLHLETSLATATAYYDSTFKALKGTIENKKEVTFEKHIEYKDREVHDTTYLKEPFPVEVEKVVAPKIFPWSLAFNFLVLAIIGIWIYFKVKRKF